MKGFLSRYTKRIDIIEFYSSFSKYSKITPTPTILVQEHFQNGYAKELLMDYREPKPHQFTGINLSHHAFMRWNERVAISEDRSSLETYINLLNSFGRIEYLSASRGVIDKEIIFTYEIQDNLIDITTFYGRISQLPSLNQFDKLRSYNFKNGNIKLSLDHETLKTFVNPPVPSQRMVFRGGTSSYLIDKYSDHERSLFVQVVLEGAKAGTIRYIYTDNPTCSKIEKSARQALIMMGHTDFVHQHIAFHYPEKLQEHLERYNRI